MVPWNLIHEIYCTWRSSPAHRFMDLEVLLSYDSPWGVCAKVLLETGNTSSCVELFAWLISDSCLTFLGSCREEAVGKVDQEDSDSWMLWCTALISCQRIAPSHDKQRKQLNTRTTHVFLPLCIVVMKFYFLLLYNSITFFDETIHFVSHICRHLVEWWQSNFGRFTPKPPFGAISPELGGFFQAPEKRLWSKLCSQILRGHKTCDRQRQVIVTRIPEWKEEDFCNLCGVFGRNFSNLEKSTAFHFAWIFHILPEMTLTLAGRFLNHTLHWCTMLNEPELAAIRK